MLRIIQKQKD